MTADHKSEACCSHTAADTEPLSSQEPAQKVCSCCTKHTLRSEAERRKLVNRLKRIEGQIRGIIGMLENDAYCNDIDPVRRCKCRSELPLIKSFLPTISEPAWQEIFGRVRTRPLMSLLQHCRSL